MAAIEPAAARAHEDLAEDVRRGLLRRPRSIPPKWFYDETGSALFDRICELPEYYPTRTERGILERESERIVERTGARELFELGSGSARKTGHLLAAIARRHGVARYRPFDISREALETCTEGILRVVPDAIVDPIVGDFEHDLRDLELPKLEGRRLFAFLGGTIGNLDERAAPNLVQAVRRLMRPGDSMIVGFDLVKDTATLEAAYDDRAGVTARFNKNVLAVINRALGADFDLGLFEHVARYDRVRSRIEMHLESKAAQRVRIRALGIEVAFARGERILTEISRKFTRTTAEGTLRDGGLRPTTWIPSPDGWFALAIAERTP